MRIEDITLDRAAGKSRIAAKVVWEDSERPAANVFFETEDAFGDGLSATADPFLAASLMPALFAGERRIRVQGDVCPELLENLRIVQHVFRHWFELPPSGAAIEATPRSMPINVPAPGNAAIFFSGGIDSLAAFRSNRVHCPSGHPAFLKDALIVYGLEVESEQPFRYVLDALSELAHAGGLTMVPVATNLRCLNPSWAFWYNAHMGPALCAIAHAFGRRLSSATIGSDYDFANLVPHGSHPLVEPYFSSYLLKIRYHGLTMTRLDKVRLVADWAPALRNLRVCNKTDVYRPGQLNCGACEKCVRTMLALVAVGAFANAPVFVQRELTPALIEGLYWARDAKSWYEELIAPLATVGRADLSLAVQQRLSRARGETGLTGRIKKFDRERLNGSLLSLKRAFVPLPN